VVGLVISPALVSPSAPGGLKTLKWLPQAACGEVSLSLSLSLSVSGRVSSPAALLCDMVLANLKTSARVTSLLILLLENIY